MMTITRASNRKRLVTSVYFVLIFCLAIGIISAPISSADKKYAGKTLTVAIKAGVIGNMVKKFAREWEHLTGARVVVADMANDVIYSKLMMEFEAGTGAYDVVAVHPAWYGDFVGKGYLRPLDKYLANMDSKWYDDFLPAQRVNVWGGKTYGLLCDGDVLSLYYRKDLFENREERQAFRRKYGYDLSPDMTWDQYLDVAEFFTRKPGEKLAGKTLTKPFYGCIELTARWGIFWWFINRYLCYSGEEPSLFDLTTMEPRISSAAGLKAMENMVKTMDYSPPGTIAFEYLEFTSAFLNGDVAMEMMWPDIGRWGSDPEQSAIVGKIGFALAPSAKVNGKTYRRTLVAPAGAMTIPTSCKNPDMAFDFIKWWLSPENCLKYLEDKEGGIDPFRTSSIKNAKLRKLFGREYMDNHAASLSIGWPDLNIPGAEEYNDVLAVNISKAMNKEITPKQAVDAVAQAWRAITQRRGTQRQLELYRTAFGLN